MAADALYAGYHGWRCPALRLQRLKMPCASTATAGATLYVVCHGWRIHLHRTYWGARVAHHGPHA
eukprot:CAMPEP_0184382520 /NCGR_PEP_ID=MMETSP0007-20130409/6401_1 /TAXON_ID=97485 /ORGANISM="Prymnesium parvum, Strain Texoma1" /LENGTH=64 /DNA_ID=CAMNT_0026728591 /DNA_START=116 /DNA_END=310 /DNA_ORIENTATION=+